MSGNLIVDDSMVEIPETPRYKDIFDEILLLAL